MVRYSAAMSGDLLRTIGQRVRARRLERGATLREVAGQSGVSPRFLVQLEAGRGNISVRRLADIAPTLRIVLGLPPDTSERSGAPIEELFF